MQLAQEQENALQEMLSGKNVFLTGEAGTGKSTIVKEFPKMIALALVTAIHPTPYHFTPAFFGRSITGRLKMP